MTALREQAGADRRRGAAASGEERRLARARLFRRFAAAALVAVSLILGGCAAPAPTSAPGTPDRHLPMGDLAARAYVCDNGSRLVAERAGEDRLYLFFPARNVELQRVPAASGSRYLGAEGVSFQSGGREARVTTADGRTLHCEEDRFGSLVEDARLRGVDFLAVGNEPGWRLELGPRRTTLVTDYGSRTLRFPAADAEARLARESGFDLTLETDDARLRATLTPAPCRDDMSGRAFDWQVALELDGQALQGCGIALH